MKRYNKMIRYAVLVAFALTTAVAAQAQKASTSYRGSTRDPFVAWKPAPRKPKKTGPSIVDPPSIQARIDAYKAQKLAAMNTQLPAPKATTALLLNEVQLTGIFRTPRGYAAMVEATPIKLSFVIYPGEKFFDGMLVAIEENRLVCRKETRWSDGRRELGVEFKALGVPNAVKDSMASSTAAAPTQSPAEQAALSETSAAAAENTPRLNSRPNTLAASPNKPERKGVWGLIDKHVREMEEQAAKCPGGKGVINADGMVTCRE